MVLNVNRMLYDFHKTQNAKRPASLHATYLVSGTEKVERPVSDSKAAHDDDIQMTSSPFPGSWRDKSHEEYLISNIPVNAVKLVREEHLEG
jgi:DNA polymerase delta subunit 3